MLVSDIHFVTLPQQTRRLKSLHFFSTSCCLLCRATCYEACIEKLVGGSGLLRYVDADGDAFLQMGSTVKGVDSIQFSSTSISLQ